MIVMILPHCCLHRVGMLLVRWPLSTAGRLPALIVHLDADHVLQEEVRLLARR